MRLLSAAVLVLGVLATGSAWSQETSVPLPAGVPVPSLVAGRLSFSFVPNAPRQPSWSITIDQDRRGIYKESAEGAPSQSLQVSETVWKRLQAGNKTVSSGHCETKIKGIAQTGEKTFSVALGPSLTSCKFNYSDDEALNDAASAFIALAQTVHLGAKLQRDRRFDKLALDADMDSLVAEVDAGRALEPRNIAAVLQSLVDDDHVIDRVRRKAARLLQDAGDKPR